jgi:rubrerythrin
MAKDRGRTRRELLLSPGARRARNDADRLARLLAFEELTVDVYDVAVRRGRLSAHVRRTFAGLRDQEQSHADALAAHLKLARARHALSEPAIERALAREGVHARLAGLSDEPAWLSLFAQVENALEGAYYLAVKHLIDDQAALLAATILANEAQHASVLSELARPGRPALAAPAALVEGSAAPAPD